MASLVERGGEQAFATIYERYHEPLYRYCVSILADRDDAYDALQATLTNSLVALGEGRRDAPLRPWLFRLARDEAISLARHRATVGRPERSGERLAPSVEDQADERARLALLVADLRALPPRQRHALLMREVSGLSHEEIATALGISVPTVRGALFRARSALVECREGRSIACETVRRAVSDEETGAVRRRHVSAHLRDCGGCAAFAAAIPGRSRDWHALAAPLPATASTGLLARVLGAGSGHIATTSAGGALVGASGQSLGAGLAAKAVIGVVIAATATATLNGVSKGDAQSHARRADTAHRSAGARARRTPTLGARVSRLRPGPRSGLAGAGRPRRTAADSGTPSSGLESVVPSRRSSTSTPTVGGPKSASAPAPRPGRTGVGPAPRGASAEHHELVGGSSGPPKGRRRVARDTNREGNPAGHGAGSGGRAEEARQAGGPGGTPAEVQHGGPQPEAQAPEQGGVGANPETKQHPEKPKGGSAGSAGAPGAGVTGAAESG